ncbi:MAG: aminodeoxychorismate lyase [Gammaproteobacteria bacterium]|nr:aminodeoxychorismate lyase [Pseudomonadales bacterium]MCP5346248.1 aminodeoxychorismate lyase [Pseudomonadales bacterium]
MSTSLINGASATVIPISDRAFQYGDGVFETLRIVNGRATLWEQHRRRLLAGCRFLQIAVDEISLAQEFQQLLAGNAPNGIAKILISRGSGGRGYQPPAQEAPQRILQFHPWPDNLDLPAGQGIRARLCKHPLSRNPALTRYKHLCRLDQVIASAELNGDIREGVMQIDSGQVIEGTRSNLFLVVEGRLTTPALTEAGIHGVMREYLLQQFASAGVTVDERAVTVSELQNAQELFFCNSVFGVWPVTELELGKQVVRYTIGPRALEAGSYVEDAFHKQN